jgi:hypothetical protein
MTHAPATLSPATGPGDLDDLARDLAGRGWVVRLELHCFAPGARAGHLVLTRPRSSAAEHVVALPRRHEIHVWTRTGGVTRPLGTVSGVDEVHELLRRESRSSGAAGTSRVPGADLAA